MNTPKLASLQKRAKREASWKGHKRLVWGAAIGPDGQQWQAGVCTECSRSVTVNQAPQDGQHITGELLTHHCE